MTTFDRVATDAERLLGECGNDLSMALREACRLASRAEEAGDDDETDRWWRVVEALESLVPDTRSKGERRADAFAAHSEEMENR